MIEVHAGVCGELLIFGTNQQFATHRFSFLSELSVCKIRAKLLTYKSLDACVRGGGLPVGDAQK